MPHTDQIIACVDCTTEFNFTAKEQEFYAEKGFTSLPKRCKPCRNARKEQGNAPGGRTTMTPGGASYGGHGHDAPRERELHTVICAACNAETQVPFKPRGDRPVYCRACFNSAGR